jgi:hypothetical protein
MVSKYLGFKMPRCYTVLALKHCKAMRIFGTQHGAAGAQLVVLQSKASENRQLLGTGHPEVVAGPADGSDDGRGHQAAFIDPPQQRSRSTVNKPAPSLGGT